MKLYYTPGACSFAPHIILRETKLPFTLERIDLATRKTERGADYFSVNAKGMVPVLEFAEGERLTEGPVIVQYLCDKAGRTDLMPAAGSLARYRVMEWQNYIGAELHKSFATLFNPSIDSTSKAVLVGILRKRFEWVSAQLKGRATLTGDTFTGADAYLFTVSQWPKFVGFDIGDLTDLQAYLHRIAAMPAVQQALKAEGLA
jgi:glutathione S-transferase